MTARAVGVVLALLVPLAALAETPEEEATYMRAYKHCQEKRMIAEYRKEPIAPAAMALEHIGGRQPRGLEFHAYLGCKDALMNEPARSSAASAAFDARRRAQAERDSWKNPQPWWLPGLGPYTWVFFADLLLGIASGILVQRRHDRRASADGRWSTLKGTAAGVAVAVMGFGVPYVAMIFMTFLSDPTPPLHFFFVTAAIILIALAGGLASLALPV